MSNETTLRFAIEDQLRGGELSVEHVDGLTNAICSFIRYISKKKESELALSRNSSGETDYLMSAFVNMFLNFPMVEANVAIITCIAKYVMANGASVDAARALVNAVQSSMLSAMNASYVKDIGSVN